MPKSFTNVKDWIAYCDHLDSHPEEREVYEPSRSTADSTSTSNQENNMPTKQRLFMHDVTVPTAETNDAERPCRAVVADEAALSGRALMLARMKNHGQKLPWEDATAAAKLSGPALMMFRMKRGGGR